MVLYDNLKWNIHLCVADCLAMSIRQFLPLITWHGRPRWISCPWKKALIVPGHTTHWWSRVPDKPFKPKRGAENGVWRQMSLHCVPTDLCRLARIGALLVLHQFESKKKDTDTKKKRRCPGPVHSKSLIWNVPTQVIAVSGVTCLRGPFAI